MATRIRFVVKIGRFLPQNDDEIGFRRQKLAFFSPKWRRDWGSSSKISFLLLKLVTRLGLVAKIVRFPPQNGDEIGPRRQNCAFSAPKWRRDWGSSSKISFLLLKLVTRLGLVAKIVRFPPQNGVENGFRRQKKGGPVQKRRRDWASSPKKGGSRAKKTTRLGLVSKIGHSPPQNGDETKRGSQPPPSQIRKINKIHFPIFIISVKIKFA